MSERFILYASGVSFFFVTLLSSTTKDIYACHLSITVHTKACNGTQCYKHNQYIKIRLVVKVYIVNSLGKCVSLIVVGNQRGIESQLHTAMQQI